MCRNMDIRTKKMKIVKEYLILTIVTSIMVFADYVFKFPNHFTFGGVAGFSVLLSGIFGGTANTYAFTINIILLVVGFIVLGKGFGMKSVYVSFLMSAELEAVQYLFPFKGPLTEQPFMELFFAFVLAAGCSAIFFNMGASSGGTDIIALILKKYTNIQIGRALLITDFCVVLLSFHVYGVTIGMFSMVGFLAKSFFVDSAIESLNRCKYFTIVSSNAEPICEFIHNELNHSSTIYHAEGSYSHKDKTVIMTVVNKDQAVKLRNYIRSTDEHAFMMITNSSEIIGNGFQSF